MQPRGPELLPSSSEEELARRYSPELPNELIGAERIPEPIVEVRSCRTLAELRHAPHMALIPLSYGFDNGRIIKTIPATPRPASI